MYCTLFEIAGKRLAFLGPILALYWLFPYLLLEIQRFTKIARILNIRESEFTKKAC